MPAMTVATAPTPARMTLSRGEGPYATPPAGAPLRLAFVGQSTFFEVCSLTSDTRELTTRFVEFRKGGDVGAMLTTLRAWRPHVVLVFRPEIIPAGVFSGLEAATLGFLTEPLPRRRGPSHRDLEIRLAALREVDPGNFDRVIAFDPHIADAAEGIVPIWRSLPLPVDDRLFAPVQRIEGRPRVVFVGRSTGHREHLLTPVKHSFDVLHVAFGADADRVVALMREHDVGINLHNEPYPSFENRVSLHLAAGHLVVSEPLDPLHGLEPGIDFVEIAHAGHLHAEIAALQRVPNARHRVRVRGRMKAEGFRASRVYARLVHDLLLDLRAFGTARSPTAG